MKPLYDAICQLLAPPCLTLRDIEEELRKVARSPEHAERLVGNLYGGVFKKKEAVYDAAGGRWPHAARWPA